MRASCRARDTVCLSRVAALRSVLRHRKKKLISLLVKKPMPPRRRGDLDPALQNGEYWVDAVVVGLLLAVAVYFLVFW